MSEINYNEIIIIPFLQKKCQDLLNLNLVFEANLSVEQAKSKDSFTYFSSQIEELQRKISTVTDERNNAQSQNNIQLQNKIDELRRVTIEQSNLILIDRQKITDQNLEIEKLKISIELSNTKKLENTNIVRKTKKQAKSGGETY